MNGYPFIFMAIVGAIVIYLYVVIQKQISLLWEALMVLQKDNNELTGMLKMVTKEVSKLEKRLNKEKPE